MPPRRLKPKASRAARGPSTATPAHATRTQNDPEDDISEIPIHALSLSNTTKVPIEVPPKKERVPRKPFRFLDLPTELRIEIYILYFAGTDHVIDLDADNYKRIHKKLGIFRTCRTLYLEASHVFYTTRTFRIFPTQPGRSFKTKKPLLARLSARQRRLLTSLELRLGPGWNKPPRGWVVNPALGLSECAGVHKLTVFVQCDPSDNVFEGFREADGFYEGFSKTLLDQVLAEMPFVDRVHFDAWSSVKKSGAMMAGLLDVAKARGKEICWGPERNWTDNDDDIAHVDSAIV
ncbi:hypothetical protein C8A00DRAFT_37554 [Chaetomidium leptoderma]|uniref:Uncharacterized protein n=1 Tax=Chaetomidium leptoderma TaxID=669021 RepID=A0AAN6VEB3_9PEZI|nr:hypothetical protein C8A00DRAFT_37554 [Chaetomidium leptoderma]